jgi:hypothetical protein
MPTVQIPSTRFELFYFNIPVGQQATVTISGTWKFDPNRAPCGPAGTGGPIDDGSFPVPAAPIGCVWWEITGPGQKPQYGYGWCTEDNQTIVFGGTTPGDGNYNFGINDNNLSDNSGSMTLTWEIS